MCSFRSLKTTISRAWITLYKSNSNVSCSKIKARFLSMVDNPRNEIRRYKCDVFSYWIKPCLVIDRNQAQLLSAVPAYLASIITNNFQWKCWMHVCRHIILLAAMIVSSYDCQFLSVHAVIWSTYFVIWSIYCLVFELIVIKQRVFCE